MCKRDGDNGDDDLSRLELLQLALVRTQQAAAQSGQRVVLVLEGRDNAGKDGSIKRITEHLLARRELAFNNHRSHARRAKMHACPQPSATARGRK